MGRFGEGNEEFNEFKTIRLYLQTISSSFNLFGYKFLLLLPLKWFFIVFSTSALYSLSVFLSKYVGPMEISFVVINPMYIIHRVCAKKMIY